MKHLKKKTSEIVTLSFHCDDHLDLLHSWLSDPEIRYLNEIPHDASPQEVMDSIVLTSDGFFLIYCGNIPVGFVALIRQKDGFYQVPITIAVKEYRRRGIGKTALAIALSMPIRGKRRFVQKVRPENSAMLALSLSCGFEVTGREGQYFRLEKRGL